MKYLYQFVLTLIFITLAFPLTGQTETINVGIIYDGDVPKFNQAREILKKEINSITKGTHTVKFHDKMQLSGNWKTQQIKNAIETLMSSDDVDMIIAIGEISSHEICRRSSFKKPVFAANIINAELQQIPFKNGASGIHNLNYLNNLSDIELKIQEFRKIQQFSKVSVLLDESLDKAIPQISRYFESALPVKSEIIKVSNSAKDTLLKISPETDAVFIFRIPRFSVEEFNNLIKGISSRKLPVYSFRGRNDVEMGALASTADDNIIQYIMRKIAVNVQETIDGAKPENLSVLFASQIKLIINRSALTALNARPDWNTLIKAELIEGKTAETGKASISMVIQEALNANLDLLIANRSVTAGESALQEARASLLPQLNIGSQAIVIDHDRAKAYSGTQPQRHWTGSLEITQLIYSEKAWSEFEMERFLQKSREQELNIAKLDILQTSAAAYLNVLRAKSMEKIQAENLKLTTENLERAGLRMKIGTGGPEEVHRWENQIAISRSNLLKSQSDTLNTVSAINNILNRPIGDNFLPQDVDYTAPLNILPDMRIIQYMKNSKDMNLLRDFIAAQGLINSPELKQIHLLIKAKERKIVQLKREFWIPTVHLFGNVTESLSKTGEQSDYPKGMNDTDWSAGVRLSLPLYSGGGKRAELDRLEQELLLLKFQEKRIKNIVEQGILKAFNQLHASYPGIKLSSDAAVSAQKNFKLVTDFYSNGIKSIIDVIDAQNQMLVANQQAINASYDFIMDLIDVQRSLGYFFLFESQEDRDIWINRLDQYISTNL